MVEVTNYIDRLVAELCPDGVDFYTIDELITLDFGTRITKSKDAGTIYPVYGGGGASFRTDNYNREDKYVVSRFAMSEKCVRYVSGKFWMLDSGFTYSVKDESLLSYKYISYWLLNAQQEIYACSSQSAQRNLKTAEFKRFEVPVPPLEIQEAIVEILDKFTNLEAELEAELEARTLQYGYYRNSLFESLKDPVNGLPVIANLVKELCPDGVKYSTLKSVSLKTTNIKWERSEDAEYRYIDLSSVPTGGSSIGDTEIINSENAPSRARQIVHTDDILFGTTRPLLDRVVIVPEEYDRQICSTGYAVIRPDTNVVIPSYIYHILREKNFSAYVEKNQTGAAYPAISFKSVMEYTVPLPPLEIQQRIVDILDRFDALTSSLSEGLPAELAARRSQYEYYRDQLLTFPRKGENQ